MSRARSVARNKQSRQQLLRSREKRRYSEEVADLAGEEPVVGCHCRPVLPPDMFYRVTEVVPRVDEGAASSGGLPDVAT